MQHNNYSQPESILIKVKENTRIRELNIKLLEACKLEDVTRVSELINKGANLHLLDKIALRSYNDSESSLTHIAARVGALEILKLLAQSSADCNAKDRRDSTPLHFAVYNGYGAIIDFLISECNVDIEAKDVEGGTPLSWAAYENKLEIAEQLLKLGAKIDEPDFEKRTSLHWAAYRGHKTMVKFLVSKGANTNAKTSADETPLDIAVSNGRTEVAEFLYQP